MNQKTTPVIFSLLAIVVILVTASTDAARAKGTRSTVVSLKPQVGIASSSMHQKMSAILPANAHRRYLLVHYMPWFEANAATNTWGWHWTMNHYQPGNIVNGKRAIASHYYPLIGPYDSSDPDVIEYHVLLMKFAGIDGTVIDWYGNTNFNDYGLNHRNAQHLVAGIEKAHLHFAAMYEDGVADTLIKSDKIPASQAIALGQSTLTWLANNWFSSPSYVMLDNKPLFMTFGVPGYYKTSDWNQIFSVLPQQPEYITESSLRAPAEGAFSWPSPFGGTEKSFQDLNSFYGNASKWPTFIAGAYPRFVDIYKDAGVGPSWGSIDDQNGQTYQATLTKALQSNAPIVQIATWNDWGEGTMIEPSVEYGYRDLETTQRLVKQYLNPGLRYTPGDLRLPLELYKLRKAATTPAAKAKLNRASALLFAGKTTEAKTTLDVLTREVGVQTQN